MKVLVTGATGFLGGYLTRRLITNRFEVIAFGRNSQKGQLLEKAGANFHIGDITKFSDLFQATKGVDYVFHCAALSSPWGSYEDFHLANLVGTEQIVKAFLENNCKRLIHVSSPAIYCTRYHRYNIKEDDPLPKDSINHYAKTKLLAEGIIDQAVKNLGLKAVTIRPQAIFGPGDSAIFPRLIKANSKFGIPKIEPATVTIDVTYVENVVDAMLLCMEAEATVIGKKYNITNGDPLKLEYLLEQLFTKLKIDLRWLKFNFNLAYGLASFVEFISKAASLRKEPNLTRYGVCLLGRSRTLNIDAAREDLGYKPNISIEEGIDRFAKHWRSQ